MPTLSIKPDSMIRVLQARGLRLSFNRRIVLEDVDLDIRSPSVVLLRGANGSGKTCLVDILTGTLEPTAGTLHLGNGGQLRTFTFPSPGWRRLLQIRQTSPEGFARHGVGRSWQDLRLFDSLSVGENLAVADAGAIGDSLWGLLGRLGLARRREVAARQRSHEMIGDLGLTHGPDFPSRSVSSGQGRRLTIGRALMTNPAVVFLDEPLAGLDAAGARDVIQLIRRVAANRNLAIVIIEHTLNVPWVLELATEVWTIRDGRLFVDSPEVVRGDYTAVSAPSVPSWVEWIVGPDARVSTTHLPRGASFHVMERDAPEVGTPALRVDGLVVRRGQHLVVGRGENETEGVGLSLAVAKGQLALLTAPNGWGKTTLVETLAGTVQATTGALQVAGAHVAHLPPWARARRGLAVLRSGDNSFPGLSVKQVLQLAGVSTPALIPERLCQQNVNSLSGGERQLLAVEAAIGPGTRRCDMVVLDEPFQGLDDAAIRRVCAYLRELLPDRGVLVMLPTPLGESSESTSTATTEVLACRLS